MHWSLDHLQGMADGPQLFFRSTHVYLLWSSLVNLALGCYFLRWRTGFLRHVQTASSALILLGPALLSVSFAYEHYNSELLRPHARAAIYFAFAGIFLQAVTATLKRPNGKPSSTKIQNNQNNK